jgi:hypothetical protein
LNNLARPPPKRKPQEAALLLEIRPVLSQAASLIFALKMT